MTTYGRADQYRIMWIFVTFDLPTETRLQRKEYVRFRTFLLQDGFAMQQFSLYIRHTNSYEHAEVHKRRVRKHLPRTGRVMMYNLTDKQFGMMENFSGPHRTPLPSPPGQLTIF